MRPIYLFTGQIKGGARQTYAERLSELGVVGLYLVRTAARVVPGPVRFPPEAVVVIDVRYMSHRHSEELVRRAKSSKVPYVVERAGPERTLLRLREVLAA